MAVEIMIKMPPVNVAECRAGVFRRRPLDIHLMGLLIPIHDEDQRRVRRNGGVSSNPVVLEPPERAVAARHHGAKTSARLGCE
jgi:hypothetical protein